MSADLMTDAERRARDSAYEELWTQVCREGSRPVKCGTLEYRDHLRTGFDAAWLAARDYSEQGVGDEVILLRRALHVARSGLEQMAICTNGMGACGEEETVNEVARKYRGIAATYNAEVRDVLGGSGQSYSAETVELAAALSAALADAFELAAGDRSYSASATEVRVIAFMAAGAAAGVFMKEQSDLVMPTEAIQGVVGRVLAGAGVPDEGRAEVAELVRIAGGRS